jgi:hypothetical protein
LTFMTTRQPNRSDDRGGNRSVGWFGCGRSVTHASEHKHFHAHTKTGRVLDQQKQKTALVAHL